MRCENARPPPFCNVFVAWGHYDSPHVVHCQLQEVLMHLAIIFVGSILVITTSNVLASLIIIKIRGGIHGEE